MCMYTCCADVEYVKVILQSGHMVGAILIGETDLEVIAHTHNSMLTHESLCD